MAKLILTKNGKILQEITLLKERITIGRRSHNDVVIEDIAISGEHAAILASFNEAVLEDLNSTNGTQVNGQPVKKHFLQHQDVIDLADYSLRYIADTDPDDEDLRSRINPTAKGIVLDAMLNTVYPKMWRTTVIKDVAPPYEGAIKLLSGARAGSRINLTKPLTTLGQPGLQVAAIVRQGRGYCLAHVEGDAYPLINGHSIGTDVCIMSDGDVIDFAGTRMEFLSLCRPTLLGSPRSSP